MGISLKTLDKLNELRRFIETLSSVMVAFSGGVDSTLLAYVCNEVLGEKAVAVTVHSELMKDSEIEEAKKIARKIGIRHIVLDISVLENKQVCENSKDRCYYCKKGIYTTLKELALNEGYLYVLDGKNIDDDKGYRPGAKALKELEITCPLYICDLNKSEIYEISKYFSLPTSDKPANPCLATRLPYGEEISVEKLTVVEAAEDILAKYDFKNTRARLHGNLLRIELPENDIETFINSETRKLINSGLRELGVQFITLDLDGYKSGCFDN